MKNGHPIPKDESSRAHGNSNTSVMTVTDPVIQFHGELVKTFGPLDRLPIPDGKVQRFHVPGDRVGTCNGWYVLHLDSIAWGVFGSWKKSGTGTWSSRRAANYEEAQWITRRKELVRQQVKAEQYLRQLKTAAMHPDEKASKPLFIGHSILTQRISLAHELGCAYLENTNNYLASVHSLLED